MTDDNRSRGREIIREMFSPGFGNRRRQRGTRRKSKWNAVPFGLVFVIATLAYFITVRGVWQLRIALVTAEHRSLGDAFRTECGGLPLFLLFVSPLLSSFPPAMIAANALLWRIPSARLAFEREAGNHWHASYSDAQADLQLLCYWLMPIGLGSALLAAYFFPGACRGGL
jgi:hypothetical protein